MQGLEEYSRTAEQTARDQLVVDHLWLVRHIVGKMAARFPPGVDVENLEYKGRKAVQTVFEFDLNFCLFD